MSKRNLCRKRLGYGATQRCSNHICKLPKGHEGKHECSCGVCWHFEKHEPQQGPQPLTINPFEDPSLKCLREATG